MQRFDFQAIVCDTTRMNTSPNRKPFSFSALVAEINKESDIDTSPIIQANNPTSSARPRHERPARPIAEPKADYAADATHQRERTPRPAQRERAPFIERATAAAKEKPTEKTNLAAKIVAAHAEPELPVENAEPEVTITFAELNLSEPILRVLNEMKFIKPTPIQAQSIPALMEGRDLVGIAQTGTGKTGAFLLPTLMHLAGGRRKLRMPRCIVLVPTRELALQVQEELERFTKYMNITHTLIIGGASMNEQTSALDKGVDVMVATPGRLLDLFDRKKIMLLDVKHLIIDEADRMLDMGFMPDIERICSLVPFTRQTMLFSATMPPEIAATVERFMQAPVRVEAARPSTVNTRIAQYALCVDDADFEQRAALRQLIEWDESFQNAIIFCNMKVTSSALAKSFTRHGYAAAALHSDLSQDERFVNLKAFRDGTVKLLVASDVAARGLDIPNVSHVINFDVPKNSEDYVHRIGRTGRGGKTGVSVTLISPSCAFYAKKIQDDLSSDPQWIDEFGQDIDRPSWWDEASSKQPKRGGRPSTSGGEKPRGRSSSGRGKR